MRWTKQNKKKLRKFLTARRPLQEIADFFDTTISSIISIRAKIQYQLFCMECGKPVKNGAKRCPQCSRQNTLRTQKEKWKEQYHNDKKFRDIYLHNRNEQRFGSIRGKVILRDKSKCVVCGMTREEHYQKYNIDLKVCSKKISKRTKKPKTDITKLETLCLECQGRKRVKARVQDWSMTGFHSHKKENIKKIKIRCYHCKEYFIINYEPTNRNNRNKWLNQKCKFCNKLLYEKEKTIS